MNVKKSWPKYFLKISRHHFNVSSTQDKYIKIDRIWEQGHNTIESTIFNNGIEILQTA